MSPLGKYTLLCSDGLGASPLGPDAPTRGNTAHTLTEARRMFSAWLRDSGNNYARSEGYGAPFADIVHTGMWDGISYGDITGGDGVERLTVGPRGGIIRENF